MAYVLTAQAYQAAKAESLLLKDDGKTTQGNCPVDSIYAYSTLGATVNVEEGTVANFL